MFYLSRGHKGTEGKYLHLLTRGAMVGERGTKQMTEKRQVYIPRQRVRDRVQSTENQALMAMGFEPTREDDLWRKDGVWFGRNAALQKARQTLHTNNGKDVFDEQP
jgi:hypothetical protein